MAIKSQEIIILKIIDVLVLVGALTSTQHLINNSCVLLVDIDEWHGPLNCSNLFCGDCFRCTASVGGWPVGFELENCSLRCSAHTVVVGEASLAVGDVKSQR